MTHYYIHKLLAVYRRDGDLLYHSQLEESSQLFILELHFGRGLPVCHKMWCKELSSLDPLQHICYQMFLICWLHCQYFVCQYRSRNECCIDFFFFFFELHNCDFKLVALTFQTKMKALLTSCIFLNQLLLLSDSSLTPR